MSGIWNSMVIQPQSAGCLNNFWNAAAERWLFLQSSPSATFAPSKFTATPTPNFQAGCQLVQCTGSGVSPFWAEWHYLYGSNYIGAFIDETNNPGGAPNANPATTSDGGIQFWGNNNDDLRAAAGLTLNVGHTMFRMQSPRWIQNLSSTADLDGNTIAVGHVAYEVGYGTKYQCTAIVSGVPQWTQYDGGPVDLLDTTLAAPFRSKEYATNTGGPFYTMMGFEFREFIKLANQARYCTIGLNFQSIGEINIGQSGLPPYGSATGSSGGGSDYPGTVSSWAASEAAAQAAFTWNTGAGFSYTASGSYDGSEWHCVLGEANMQWTWFQKWASSSGPGTMNAYVYSEPIPGYTSSVFDAEGFPLTANAWAALATQPYTGGTSNITFGSMAATTLPTLPATPSFGTTTARGFIETGVMVVVAPVFVYDSSTV